MDRDEQADNRERYTEDDKPDHFLAPGRGSR
jgi:hypothetical protein